MRIALDALGGDFGAKPNVLGAVKAAGELGCEIILVGDSAVIEKELATVASYDKSKISVVHAPDMIDMAAHPARECRDKKNASIVVCARMGSNYSAAADDKLTPQQAALKNGFTKTAKLIGDFIAYKNIPRDEQGRPVIQPKTQQQSAQPLQNTTGKINNNQGKQSSPKPKKAPVKTVINKLKTSTL